VAIGCVPWVGGVGRPPGGCASTHAGGTVLVELLGGHLTMALGA
jgi:hypothetical protein